MEGRIRKRRRERKKRKYLCNLIKKINEIGINEGRREWEKKMRGNGNKCKGEREKREKNEKTENRKKKK